MNALFAILVWFASLFSPEAAINATPDEPVRGNISTEDLSGVHIINVNPRTVVALEDTHFRPNN
ncbi:MAG: hypothetical protein AAF570_20370 [Bacteroidota bacterium]